jgi:antitoxin (DNA-binding transcriptional repressor) of toxin-antitoxin stability system
LPPLIDAVAGGEEVIITRAEGAAFNIVPVPPLIPHPTFGSAKGWVKMAEDFDEP